MANYSSVGDVIPQLAGLTPDPPFAFSPGLGGQNYTHCCLRALNSSVEVEPGTGNLTYAAGSFVAPGVSVEDLLATTSDADNFPCGAEYTPGKMNGSPEILVPYAWCRSECGGWELSRDATELRQWIGPLVQFIVPSLSFSLNIPRARKLAVPDFVFKAHPRTLLGLSSYWLRLLVALLLMTVDTVVWLSTCFAFAAPMLGSAVYEFVLDRRILEFLAPPPGRKGRKGRPGGAAPVLSYRLRAQLLISVVVGNIRMAKLERSTGAGPAEAKTDPESPDPGHRMVHNSIWKRINAMVDEHEAMRESGTSTVGVITLPRKLKSILNSQASFGSTMGAPVLFFVGGFIYTVLEIDNDLGDNDTAHALAFGMWWMVIPYLAIVSCAMLAANSPSTLEGIVFDGGEQAVADRYDHGFWTVIKRRLAKYRWLGKVMEKSHGYSMIETAYEGHFKPVKLWKRGMNKRLWVHEAIADYRAWYASVPPCTLPPSSASFSGPSIVRGGNGDIARMPPEPISPDELQRSLALDYSDLLNIGAATTLLFIMPCGLAFLASYNTPRKGLACRSLIYLVYAITQVLELGLWVIETNMRLKRQRRSARRPTGGSLGARDGRVFRRSPAQAACWWGQVFVGFFAILTALGGTLMQLLGVYRSCACKIQVQYWFRPNDPNALISLSSNTADSIAAAQQYWLSTGSAAVGVISLVCALAWWHQRRLRKVFRSEANSLEIVRPKTSQERPLTAG